MASTDTPVGSIASLLTAVQAQTDTTKNFKDEQINVFTTSALTANVTNADGTPFTIPSWAAFIAKLATPLPSPTPAPAPSPTPAPTGGGVRLCTALSDTLLAGDANGTVYYTAAAANSPVYVTVPDGVFKTGDRVKLVQLGDLANSVIDDAGTVTYTIDPSGSQVNPGVLFVCSDGTSKVYSPYLNPALLN